MAAKTKKTTKTKQGLNKLWIILGAVVLVVVIAAVAGWLYVVGSPQYSWYQASKSVERHDYASFSKYVDVDSVVTTAVDAAVQQAMAQSKAQSALTPDAPASEQFSQLGQAFAESLIPMMKPQLLAETKQNVKKEVETGDFNKNEHIKSVREAFDRVKVTQKSGSVVTVKVRDTDGQEVTMKMRKSGNHWQVFEIPIDTAKTNVR